MRKIRPSVSLITSTLLMCIGLLTGCVANSTDTADSIQSESNQNSEQNHGFTAVKRSQSEWWNQAYPTRFDTSQLKNDQPLLKVEGNRIVDANGNAVQLRGVNIADPDKLDNDQRWSKALFDELADWGANVIRIPIHPAAWRGKGRDWYLARLDEAVVWANANNQYLIVDWHSIGNLLTGMYQIDFYETSLEETRNFWKSIGYRYKGVSTVAVYEVFNEPTHDFIGTGAYSLGKIDWLTWRDTLESLIDIIYLYNDQAIPLVGGFNWAYDLTPIADHPVRRDGIAYAIHPYPQKAKPKEKTTENFFKLWQETWGYVADEYPVMATELGWVREDGYGAHVPVIDDGTYGPRIIEFMEARNIHWAAWCFDPNWSPTMIKDWQFTPTEQGVFFKQELQRLNLGVN